MDLTFGLGGLIGNAINAFTQNSTNQANIQAQKDTNAMEVNLADTAYQRKAADLKAAGINPLLAAGGPGQATPALVAPQQKPVQVDTNAMKIDGTALLPLLTMANQVGISSSEAARAAAQANLAKTQADVAGQYAAPQAAATLQSTEASAGLTAAEMQLKQLMTPELVQAAKADAIKSSAAARYSDTSAAAAAGLADTQYRQLKEMISENIGPKDQMWMQMSADQQNMAIQKIVGQIKSTELGQKMLDLFTSQAAAPAHVLGAYGDAFQNLFGAARGAARTVK